MTGDPRPVGGDALPSWLAAGALAGVFVGLVAWSWQKWADVQIDFGAELYAAWRLAEGDVLGRDLASRQGPLSPYLNAGWFRLFGVSIRTLVLCNLAIFAGICALTWRIFRSACDRFSSGAVVLVLLCLFGFSQYVPIANYNYATPYHHQQTHGVLATLGMIAALAAALRRAPAIRCALAGLLLGCVFLTKAELFVPAVATATLGLVLVGREAGGGRALAAFLAAASVPPVAGFGLLYGAGAPPPLALEAILGNWVHLSGLAADPFYRSVAGLDDVSANLGAALRSFAGVAAFAGAAIGLDRATAERRSPWLAPLLGAAVFAALVAAGGRVPWFRVARALPLTCGLAAAVLVARCLRAQHARAELRRWAALALYAVWATALLAKLLLRVRFEHYGFVLAMPATLLLVAALLELLPAGLLRGGSVARAVGAGAVAAAVIFFLGDADAHYRRKDFPVGRGGDVVLAESRFASARPRLVAEALARLEEALPTDGTLLVLPEGAGLNYWLRRRNPTRFALWLPTELAAFGEVAMLAGVRARPPDVVALVDRRSGEFGVGPFGEDPRNGRRLLAWIRARYHRFALLGEEPFRGGGFGIELLRRTGPAP